MNIPKRACRHHAMRASCCSGVSLRRSSGWVEGIVCPQAHPAQSHPVNASPQNNNPRFMGDNYTERRFMIQPPCWVVRAC
jgi:hypothetical protein